MHFTLLDGLIVVLYLFGIALFGILTAGRQRSARDYFLSETSVPWWAVCFAIVATETSAITFISIPGIAYVANLQFWQLTIGYLLGRILVAALFIPAYFRGELSTAYAFLEKRFGARMRRSASVVFMGTRTFADGVRLYTTAIPLALLLRGSGALPVSEEHFYILSILVMAAVTLFYVFLGGVRAVIWTDVIQMFIYIAGAAAALVLLLGMIPMPVGEMIAKAGAAGKLQLLSSGFEEGIGSFFTKPYSFPAGVIGGMFLSMASHGTDQIIVQRILASGEPRKGKRAMIASGVIVMLQFLLFLAVGILLWIYYGGAPISSNEVFPLFIINHIPSGLCGLIIAGLLAAAMSTLSGSISALSSTTMMDLVVPISRRSWSEEETLRWSRRVSLAWGAALTVAALFFIRTPKSVIELALGAASYTYGGLLGVFLLGVLFRRVGERAAIAGFATGILGMTAVILFTPIAWTWYTIIGAGLCIGGALAAEALRPQPLL